MPISSTCNTFRLFISSTFSDFVTEREALQKRVFPELEKFCAERGAMFQAIDLRWGITEEAQQEHDTLRICLEEVRRCQALSPRPNFAVLLGDRYGWEPVPARITVDHWNRLLAVTTRPDGETIRACYEGPDLNAIPPVMHLKKRQGDWALNERREALLQIALRRAADTAGFTGDERLPYFASATHQEIALGALDTKDEEGNPLHPEEHVNVYVRHIKELPNDASARAFIDWDEQTRASVQGARPRQAELERQLRERLPGKVHDIQARWHSNGTDESHIDAFCARFLADQKAIIERELNGRQRLPDSEARSAQHHSFAKERARNFAGRRPVLRRIAAYLGGRRNTSPLIIHGSGGTGKSALMARAYLQAVETAPKTTVMLARFIGGVPGTESLITLLTELTADIATAYGRPTPPIPENVKAARQAFEEALQAATAERPLVLFLDALDQLDLADGAWMLEWLPKELGEHARVVASTREGQTLLSAQRRYPKTLLEVPAMTPNEGRQMLDAWLADTREAHYNAGIAPARGRRLTPPQREQVLGTFAKNGKPLWLKLAYEEARTWPSWDDPRALPETVESMVEDLIARRLLEGENHPAVFTQQALAYLTAGRYGLSETELARALGTDPAVRREFEFNEKTQKKWDDRRRLPPVIWSRLFFDLQSYLAVTQSQGALLLRWFHREFEQTLRDRYLATEANRASIHGHLADALRDLERELRADETTDAALFRRTEGPFAPASVALRRVMEQPWQLARAGRLQALADLLTDFGFCMGKCAANAGDDLVADFLDAAPALDAGGPTRAWADLVREQGHLLRRGSPDWPAHRILLQVAMEHADDSPVTRAAQAWLDLGHCDWAWMRRVDRPHTLRTSAVLSVMEEHSEGVKGVALLPGERAVSWSHDKTLVTWDLSRSTPTGKLHTLAGALADDGLAGAFAGPGDRVACWGDTELEVWDLHAARRVGRMIRPREVIYGALPLEGEAILGWWAPRNERLAAMRSARPDLTFRIWRPLADATQAVPSLDALGIRDLKPLDPLRLAAFCGDRLLRVIDRAMLQPLFEVAHDAEVLGVRAIDASRACSWSKDRRLQVWDLATGTLHASLELGTLLSTLWVLDAQTLAGACSTRGQGWPDTDSIFIISLAQGRIVQELAGHASSVRTVQRLPDGRLLSASGDNTLRLWQATPQGYAARATVQGHTGAVNGVQRLDDGRMLSWSDDHTLRLWRQDGLETGNPDLPPAYISDHEGLAGGAVLLETNAELRACPARDDGALTRLPAPAGDRFGKCLALADGRVVASSKSGQVRLWDPASGQVQRTLSCGETLTHQLLMLDDHRLAVAGQATLQVWDLSTGRRLHALDAPGLWQLLPLPGGRVLTIRSHEVLAVWDLQAGVKLRDLTPLRSDTVFARVLPGIGLVTWDMDSRLSCSTLRVWDLDSLDLRREISTTEMVGNRMLGLSDGRIVCWSSSVAWAFDPGSDAPPLELRGHEDTRDGRMLMIVGGLELSDGRFLTHSSDCSIRVWSGHEETAQRVLRGHGASVLQVTELPGRRLLSQSIDHEMILWDLDSGRLLERSAPGWLKRQGFEPLWVDHLAGVSRWASLWLKALPRDCLVGAWRGQPLRWLCTHTLRPPLHRAGQSVVAVSDREALRLGVWDGRDRAAIET